MKKQLKVLIMLLVMLFTLSLLVACGSDSNNNNNNEKNNANETANGNNDNNETGDVNDEGEKEEITIRWAHQWGEDHFWETIGDFVQDEFPHITFEIQEAGLDHPEDVEKLVAAKKSPDVITMGLITHSNFLYDLGLSYNMDELIENSDFDLDRLDADIIQYARNQDPEDKGGLVGLPVERPTFSLHYNKDVFDTLGVDYPEDDLTWEEVYELAKDLTREVDGVQYYGLDLDQPHDMWTQFSDTNIDPETDKVDISDNYRRYLEYIDDVFSIPGYPTDEPSEMLHNWGSLFDEGDIAMYTGKTAFLDHDNIDIAAYPTWEGEEFEGLKPEPNTSAYAITEPNEHKEETLEVIAYLLSDEVQTEKSKKGTASILINEDILEVYGDDNEDLKNKNTDSLFMNEYATGLEKYSEHGDGENWEAPLEWVDSDQDINEFLRELKEELEEFIRSREASK